MKKKKGLCSLVNIASLEGEVLGTIIPDSAVQILNWS